MGNILRAGEKLTPGQKLVSPNGIYELRYQTDGNLVLYEPGNRPVWASNTFGTPASEACMQTDGHFCLYKPGHVYYWGTGVHGFSGGRLVLQDDRNLVVYRADNSPAWSTNTYTVAPTSPRPAAIPIEWLTGPQPRLLSMMASCQKNREGLNGNWWEGFANDDIRTHAQAIGQYRDTVYVAFSELSGSGQLWIYNKSNGQNSLQKGILPADHPHPCSIQVVDHYMVVAVESAYPSPDPRPEFSTIAIYDLDPNPQQPREIARIRQPDCNCGGAGLAYHPRSNRWYILADQDRRAGGGTRLYRSDNASLTSFPSTPLKVYSRRFGSGAGINLVTATDGSIWGLYYTDTSEYLPKHMQWTMVADAVQLWKLVEPDGTPVNDFAVSKQYTNVGSPQLGDAGVLLNNRPGMRFGATLRSENGQIELLTCQRNMTSTFNVDRVRLEDGKASVMFVNFGAFEAEMYASAGGQTLHSGHLPVSQSWGATMNQGSINAHIKHNAGFSWVDDFKNNTAAPLTLFVVKGETQSARVEIHNFTTGYTGKVEVAGHSPEGIKKLDPTNW